MALSSPLFTKEGPGKKRLADCAVSHQFNFFVGKPNLPGTEDAVGRIQTALRLLGFTISDAAGVYGQSTAKAVFAFKSAHRPKPILGPGQTVPDNIVGIQTIAALDTAMLKKPPGPAPPGPTPPNPQPPNPTPPNPKPPNPKPPDPTPPPPPPKPAGRAWPFNLKLEANPPSAASPAGSIFSFKLDLTDLDSRKSEEFLTFLPPMNLVNTLGTSVTCKPVGTLTFPLGTSLNDFPQKCVVVVQLKPLDRAALTGKLTVFNADNSIHSEADISGKADKGEPTTGNFFVAATLRRNSF